MREFFFNVERVKNEIRTTKTDERINQLSLMLIESALLSEIDFNDMISKYTKVKPETIKNTPHIGIHIIAMFSNKHLFQTITTLFDKIFQSSSK